jgi:metal-dependent HD superfamily phosphatase/phosphodiesterase
MERMTNIVTLDMVENSPEVQAYLQGGNKHLAALGFTDHGSRHAGIVASVARHVLEKLEYPERDRELAAIAGYLHDIGNVVSRLYHAQVGAALSDRILGNLGMAPSEIATIIGAIGSHDPEEDCNAVSTVSAALILADKSDVHRTRVRNRDFAHFDVHDRVNYAATQASLNVDKESKVISLHLSIDTEISPVMEYFEIFLTRMLACKRAAEYLDTRFELDINGVRLL